MQFHGTHVDGDIDKAGHAAHIRCDVVGRHGRVQTGVPSGAESVDRHGPEDSLVGRVGCSRNTNSDAQVILQTLGIDPRVLVGACEVSRGSEVGKSG